MSNETSFEGQADDMEAIYVFMKGQVPKTPEATTVRSQFLSWYQNLGFWDKSMSGTTYDEARTRRNQFNLKNAVTPAAVAQVEKVLASGMTTEQMEGKKRPPINVKTGAVGTQVKNPTVPGVAPGLNRFLKKGVSGDDVKQWQTFLGLTPATGYFDAITDTKTRDYQKSKGLKVDGIVGPKTWGDAFAAKAAPFVEPSKPLASSINQAFRSPPKAQTFAQPKATTPAVKSPTIKTPAAETASSTPVVAQAGMIPGLAMVENLPWWAKILGVLGIGAGVYYGSKKYEKNMPQRT